MAENSQKHPSHPAAVTNGQELPPSHWGWLRAPTMCHSQGWSPSCCSHPRATLNVPWLEIARPSPHSVTERDGHGHPAICWGWPGESLAMPWPGKAESTPCPARDGQEHPLTHWEWPGTPLTLLGMLRSTPCPVGITRHTPHSAGEPPGAPLAPGAILPSPAVAAGAQPGCR